MPRRPSIPREPGSPLSPFFPFIPFIPFVSLLLSAHDRFLDLLHQPGLACLLGLKDFLHLEGLAGLLDLEHHEVLERLAPSVALKSLVHLLHLSRWSLWSSWSDKPRGPVSCFRAAGRRVYIIHAHMSPSTFFINFFVIEEGVFFVGGVVKQVVISPQLVSHSLVFSRKKIKNAKMAAVVSDVFRPF